MGAGADNRLTVRARRAFIKGGHINHQTVTDLEMDAVTDAAEDLAQQDHMPLRSALKIVSGAATRPYGTMRRPS